MPAPFATVLFAKSNISTHFIAFPQSNEDLYPCAINETFYSSSVINSPTIIVQIVYVSFTFMLRLFFFPSIVERIFSISAVRQLYVNRKTLHNGHQWSSSRSEHVLFRKTGIYCKDPGARTKIEKKCKWNEIDRLKCPNRLKRAINLFK